MLGFPLGILSAAGAGVGVASDYELIATELVGADTPSVTFFSLATYASTYKHLQIRFTARSDRSSEADSILGIQFNALTAANYFRHQLAGNGSTVTSNAATSQTSFRIGMMTGSTSAASNFAAGVIDILDCFSTTKNKTFRSLTGSTNGNNIRLMSGSLAETSSLTEIKILDQFGNIVAGSRFSLYGIRG